MGYGRELFLMDLSLVDCNGLPAYYQNLSEAWRSLEWARKTPYCGMAAFLTEPLFFNDLFGGVKGESRRVAVWCARWRAVPGRTPTDGEHGRSKKCDGLRHEANGASAARMGNLCAPLRGTGDCLQRDAGSVGVHARPWQSGAAVGEPSLKGPRYGRRARVKQDVGRAETRRERRSSSPEGQHVRAVAKARAT
ncbi:unnamed protein product [Lampetra fluviatilis]